MGYERAAGWVAERAFEMADPMGPDVDDKLVALSVDLWAAPSALTWELKRAA